MCKCVGNQSCEICYTALCAAFDKTYAIYKAAGYEDLLEAKEFMWDFNAARDIENMEEIFAEKFGDGDPSQWTY